MLRPLVYILIFLATTAFCKKITYSVISLVPSGYTMAVVVDDVAFPLTLSTKSTILFTGSAPIAQRGYHYVKFNNATEIEGESFQRNKVEENTPNEFYNRTWNSRQIAKLPQVFEPLPVMDRRESKLHMEGEIPVIHFYGNASGIELMHSNVLHDIKVVVGMTRISTTDVQTFSNVELEIAGRSSRWYPKVSYNIKLSKKNELYGYRRFKLRALSTDPSYLREKVAYDIIKATGLPSTESSFVRVFINDRAYGLFGFIENYKTPWYSNEFKDKTKGISFQSIGGTSDLRYYSNESEFADNYKIKADPGKGQGPSNYKKLIDLTKFLAKQPAGDNIDVDDWEKWFNMDSVLRNLALEIMLGMVDGYIDNADNYYLYNYPLDNRFIFLPSDLDMSLGATALKLDLMWSGNYTEYPGYWLRPITTKISKIPKYRKQLESILLTLANNLVNPKVTNPRINGLVEMIREDVTWDQSLPRASVGIDLSGANNTKDASHFQPSKSSIPVTWDETVMDDILARTKEKIPFEVAVNGPTGHISLAGIKEWIEHQSQSIIRFLGAS